MGAKHIKHTVRKNPSYIGIRTHVPTCQKVTTSSTELPGRPARITIDPTKTRKELTVVIVPVVYMLYSTLISFHAAGLKRVGSTAECPLSAETVRMRNGVEKRGWTEMSREVLVVSINAFSLSLYQLLGLQVSRTVVITHVSPFTNSVCKFY